MSDPGAMPREPQQHRFDGNRENANITRPAGSADAALLIDKQLNEPIPAIELLTIAEAATLLKISKSGMRRLQQRRHVPFFKVGGSIRFAKRDLASYLTQQRVGSVGEYQ